MTGELSQRDRDMLDFEAGWWKFPGAKEDEIRRRFEMSPTRYYQVLNTVIDRPEALAYAPVVVKRLQRIMRRPRRASGDRGVG